MNRRLATLIATVSIMPLASSLAFAQGNNWGDVKGQVVFVGKLPKLPAVNLGNNPPACVKNMPVENESWVINPKNNGVKWTLVYLAPTPGAKAPLPIHPQLAAVPQAAVVINVPCCTFIPHFVVMREGQELLVTNNAAIPHNVVWIADRKVEGGSIVIPGGNKVSVKGLKKTRLPGRIQCNIHPWMNARAAVFDHPYFAITDDNGKFDIKQAPAGNHRIVIWHESIGWLGGAAGRDGQPVLIVPGKATDLGKVEIKEN